MRDRRAPADAGFTLIEVIVSLVLLGIVATAALYFFIEGTRTTSHLQRSQNAVAVANEAMERAYAVNPVASLGTTSSALAAGRRQADVEAAWNRLEAAGAEGLDDTYPIWDPSLSLTNSNNAAVPIEDEYTHSGQKYLATTLVGVCYRKGDVLAPDQPCTTLPSVASVLPEDSTPAGMIRLLRVITVVTWAPTAGECTSGVCTYQLSGLIDRSSDLTWNQVVDPIAVEDFADALHGETIAIPVLDNDVIGPVTSNPVLLMTYPAAGQGTVSVASNGVVTYRAPATGSGIYPFTYRIKDRAGRQSDPATVRVSVKPLAANDSYQVRSGVGTTLNLLANDNGTPASIQISSAPTSGTVAVSGLTVTYTPSVPTGTDSFMYTYTDASGQVSEPARVTILIDSLNTQDHTIVMNARSSTADVWTSLTETLLTGVDDRSRVGITITGPRPAAGSLRVDGVPYTQTTAAGTSNRGANVEFSPMLNVVGEYTFRYVVSREGGATSDPKTVTLRVVPVARPDVFPVRNHNQTTGFAVGLNDAPSVYTTASAVTVRTSPPVPADCGTFPTQARLAQGEIQVVLPTIPQGGAQRNCSFTYYLEGSGALSQLRSETVTVTYSFRRP
ncbi:prepilin-type N-terminal cleavage/methylation domain-containing protein [Actinotalea sp. BY-33]|uniref:Prepilin-type N-terminal cleavage/methylation domain-containing protein n=1 Tax=Actinotalea soli TaxID=2819234 RepID=A0A939LQW2_9CELL|nr:Ig-like domain-containing protein [Actinotalea soli]MBO1750454.1 prepilin-type N-terminal cleavage/methylation domain-containing protein [Actinotalea soli]